ncbi:hypothetical protein GHO40_23115 [Pseudomonas helleri]|uniref:Uncharacterized protein n=2 Tax=Pseudomonas helleri TaxID=1608996 RepID=A0A6A7YM73_9PSED|nr:hypothetical protein [Pseudomonas helleri]MQT32067.1 hypothetical protein [Pseudomonas helleri]MQT49595.1 hypothetical protein [Pseudomonas helleri]
MDMQSGKIIATDVDVKYWMTSLHPLVGTLKLHELKIPSTQHSGLIECESQQDESNESGSTGSPWGFQIEAGIRALDLRIYQNEEGDCFFHYNNLPSEHSVQSLIDWCNAYYSASELIINNEIIVLHIHDCFSPRDQFNDTQLRDLFVNGLRSTSLIPRRAALLNLIQIHQDYPGKNIVLSWDRCVDDDLIWPYRWQGWIKADVPVGIEHKATLPLFLICNAVTECISTLVVVNAGPPVITAGQPGACSELDHGLIEKCINYNLDAAPFYAPELEQSGYNYVSGKVYLIVKPNARVMQYQIDLLGRGFAVYPHTPSNGYHNIELPVARDQVFILTIRAMDVRGKISDSSTIRFNASAPAPVLELGNFGDSRMPKVKPLMIQGMGGVFHVSIMWDINGASDFDWVQVIVIQLQGEGIDAGLVVFDKTHSRTSMGITFYPYIVGKTYAVVVLGIYPGGWESKPAWVKLGRWS